MPPPPRASYPQILRGQTFAWWRSVLGVVCGLSLFLLLTTVVSQAVVALVWALTAGEVPYRDYFASAFAFQRPVGMLAVNLGIATLIPISWLLMALVHRVQPRWLGSVQPRLRWRYLLVCLGTSAVALNGVLAVSLLVEPGLGFGAQPRFWAFLLVIVLTSPIQAAAEEYFFRGYLTQALGSLFTHPLFGVLLSSVLFALFHGLQNPALFVDRLAFGLLAALLVWRTGGLEAGIAAHVVNNVSAYVFAGLTTSIAAVKATREITWLDAAFDVGGFVLCALLALLVARRMRLRTRVALTAGR
ncbi:MAG: CPBP family intramembrane glutamic endopeptidase [Actinomycetes bacterium]